MTRVIGFYLLFLLAYLMKFDDIQKGDNLFELIFELDRRLQISQNHSSPVSKLENSLSFLDGLLTNVVDKQPEIIDTVFSKLVDFFIKCGYNYKRQFICEFINPDANWIKIIKSGDGAVKKLSTFWDVSVLSDFEACAQILKFMNSFAPAFFDQPATYGMLFEAFSELDSAKGYVFGNDAIRAASSFMDLLFFKLNAVLDDESVLDALIPTAKFAAFTILKALKEKEINCFEMEKSLLISSLIFPDVEITKKIIDRLNDEEKLKYSVYLKYIE